MQAQNMIAKNDFHSECFVNIWILWIKEK